MKTINANATKLQGKKGTVKGTNVSKAIKASNTKADKVTTYKTNVLEVNAKYKVLSKSLGFCRSVLLNDATELQLPKEFKTFLLATKKEQSKYEILKGYVRVSKAGNYSPFFVLQGLEKMRKAGKL